MEARTRCTYTVCVPETAHLRAPVDDTLLRITNLVRARDRLRRIGGHASELEDLRAEIDSLQWRLSQMVRRECGQSRPTETRSRSAARASRTDA
jgi:hypothetical protein